MLQPYWQRLPKFFIYPFYPSAFFYLVLIGLMGYAGLLIEAYYLKLIYFILLVSLFLKFIMAACMHTASGLVNEAPKISKVLFIQNYHCFAKQTVTTVGLALIIYVICKIPYQNLQFFLMMVVCLLSPAICIVTIIEHKPLQAIHPVSMANFILNVGWPYLLMAIITLLMFIGFQNSHDILVKYFSSNIAFNCSVVLGMYLMSVVAVMYGYLAYQFHEKLGYAIDVPIIEYQQQLSSELVQKNPIVIQAEKLILEAKLDQAEKVLFQGLTKQDENFELHEKYLKLLRVQHKHDKANQHAKFTIARCLDYNKVSKATEFYLECCRHEKQFKLFNADYTLALAKAMRHLSFRHQVVNLLEDFAETFPNTPQIPDAYLLLAKTLADGLNRDSDAIEKLKYIIMHYPRQKVSLEAKKYLDVLMGM